MFRDKRPLIFVLAIIIGISLVGQQSIVLFNTYASGGSPYDSGYGHGCDDAGRSESDKYINQAEKGPSFHTEEFMSGYYDGLSNCNGGGGRDNDDGEFVPDSDSDQPRTIQPREIQPDNNPPQTGGINWENLCNQYGNLVGIKEPCSEYADGTQLTEKGRTALVCLLGGGGISILPGLDPATKAAIIELGRQNCP
jgi:hypothetical protein